MTQSATFDTTSSAINLTGGIYTAHANLQSTNTQDPLTKSVYALDGTHLTALLHTGSPTTGQYSTFLKIMATSDGGATNAQANSVFSSSVTVPFPTGTTSAGWTYTQYNNIDGNDRRAQYAPIAIDSSDNVYITLLSPYQSYGELLTIKIDKPTTGWSAWVAAGGTTALVSSTLTRNAYSAFPNTNNKPQQVIATYWTSYGYLVHLMGSASPTAGNHVMEVYNATTGAYVSRNNAAVNATTYTGVISQARPTAFANGGCYVSFAVGSTTGTSANIFTMWQVSSSGTLTSGQDTVGNFTGTTASYTNGAAYSGTCQVGFLSPNKMIFFTKSNFASSGIIWAIVGIEWYTTGAPGGGSAPYASGTYGSGSNPNTATTGSTITQTTVARMQIFQDERIIRWWNGTSTLYCQEASYDSGFTTLTFVTAPFSVASDGLDTGANILAFTEAAWDNKLVYYRHGNGGTTVTARYALQDADRAVTYSLPSAGPVGSSFIQSPFTSLINRNAGVRFGIVPQQTITSGHGVLYWGKFTPSCTGYRVKRVNGGTTDYLIASSQTFSTEATNSITVGSLLVNAESTANQWANGTAYTLSGAIVTSVGVTPYGTTRTLTTTTPSSAPSSATPRRFIRTTLNSAMALSHEYTFDNNALVNRINVGNFGTSAATFALQIGGVYLVAPVVINAGETFTIDTSQRVDSNDRILLTSTSSSVDLWVSGTEGI